MDRPLHQTHSPADNRLLAALPVDDLDRLRPNLEFVPLAFRQALHEPGGPIRFVYFPTAGLASLVAMMANGASVEVGMIGKEGVVGVSIVLGDDVSPHRAFVQVPGAAFRLEAGRLRSAFERSAAVRSLLLRYVRMMLRHISQSAACNRVHSLEPRCARWLLTTRDLVEADEFPLTHEFLALMLGVRRAGVSIAAQALQEAGLIRYRHGRMAILDPAGLEAAACECYRSLKDEADRLLHRC